MPLKLCPQGIKVSSLSRNHWKSDIDTDSYCKDL